MSILPAVETMEIKLFAVTEYERDIWVEALHINMGVPVIKGSYFEPIIYYVTGIKIKQMLIKCSYCESMSRP